MSAVRLSVWTGSLDFLPVTNPNVSAVSGLEEMSQRGPLVSRDFWELTRPKVGQTLEHGCKNRVGDKSDIWV